MKKLLTGNEAVARGAFEAGCTVATAYPGTPSTEILENIANYKEIYCEWSTNEKVALEVAGGSAIGGARTLSAMKHVGLNVAADPLYTLAYEGVNGGLIVVTADDPGCHSSQNEQDNRYVAPHAKVAMIEPSDSQECKDYIKIAFDLSEKYDTPILFRMTTRICHSKSLVELGEREEVGVKEYTKNLAKYCMAPALARARHAIVEKKFLEMQEYANNCSLNRVEWGDKRIGIITSGISYFHAREVFGKNASYLKIGLTYPLPDKMIKEFAAEVKEVYVIEENDPYLESFVKTLGIACIGKEAIPILYELNPGIIRDKLTTQEKLQTYSVDIKVPNRPPVLCAGCPHRSTYYALGKYKDIVVMGDIGCYTLGMVPPLSVTDSIICMGAGISGGYGFEKAFKQGNTEKKVFGCIGDSTFFHSGITGLINAVYNGTNMAICILDNRITAMTGHQENPGTGKTLMGAEAKIVVIEDIVKAVGVKPENIRIVNAYNLAEVEAAIKDAYEAVEVFVIIVKQPCALIKDVQKERAGMYCEIDDEKCKKCRVCLKIGCPAIAFKDGKILIDKVQCNGCGLCQQVCKFNAINKVGELS